MSKPTLRWCGHALAGFRVLMGGMGDWAERVAEVVHRESEVKRWGPLPTQ